MKKLLTIGITIYENDPFVYNLLYEISNQVIQNKDILQYVDFFMYDDASKNKEYMEYLPEYFNVKESSKNSGSPAKGRNYIIEKSNTEYILFIDGDDTIIEDISLIGKQLKNKNADIIFTPVTKIGADGQKLDSPFIYNNMLFYEESSQDVKKKICVHQTGIWSIYKVAFLKNNNLFYEHNMRYEDNYLLYNMLIKDPKIDTINTSYYGWRNNYSSFSYSDESLKHRINLYKKTMEILKDDLDSFYAPYILFSIWNQTYSNIIRNYPNLTKEATKAYFNELEKVSGEYKKEIKYLKNKIDKKYVDLYFKFSNKYTRCTIILILKKYKKLFNNSKTIKKKVANSFVLLPVNKNKNFFVSQYGEYSSNPKYYYKQIQKENNNQKNIFMVKNKELLKNKDFKDYNNRLKFYYHFYTSKNIYFDTWLDPELKKNKNQVWTQMWHGYPYKKMYTDINIYEKVNDKTKRTKKEQNILKWDYIYSLNEENTKIFRNLFPHVEIKEKLYPRIEWLIQNKNNKKLKNEIKDKYGLDKNKKYTLYAPTYRPYKVYLDINEVTNLKSPDNALLIHLHKMMDAKIVNDKQAKYVQNIDIQELILVIDEIISDYSSIIFDFEFLSSKIKLYAPDKNLYSKIHGLY